MTDLIRLIAVIAGLGAGSAALAQTTESQPGGLAAGLTEPVPKWTVDIPSILAPDYSPMDLGWIAAAGVLALLREMGIASHCAFARRVGLPDQMIQTNLAVLEPDQTPGYLAVLLIRKTPREKR